MLEFLPNFLSDALFDSVKLIPLLLLVFLLTEIFENYFSRKIITFMQYTRVIGPVVGALFAIIPQCGFSIIASTLYIKRFISMGTLLAVYLTTSDEAIAVLLADTSKFNLVWKIVAVKFLIGVIVGYAIDLIFKNKNELQAFAAEISIDDEKGCCNHELKRTKFKNLILHPLKHTLNVFIFIFIVCVLLNYFLELVGLEYVGNYFTLNMYFQPVLTSLLGLIPNCAVSVAILFMYLKNVITFGSLIAGLSSSAGLGLLVLLKKNDNIKNSFLILAILLLISVFVGILINLAVFY